MNREFPSALLTNCDKEPIHIPGAVQPSGLMLVLDAGGAIAGEAGDRALIGEMDAGAWLANSLDQPLDSLAAMLPSSGAAMLGSAPAGDRRVDIVAHRSGDHAIVEIEPSDTERMNAATALSAAQALTSRLEAAHDVVEACQAAAEAVRDLIGYDRIMIYHFLVDGSGEVVAEARSEDADSLLHHRFPASDIPVQARALYVRNPVRVIPDVDYQPAALEWRNGAEPDRPLDMSDAHLRSVSPVHIQYLKNMGVGASASISILVGGELWGLIACHHDRPGPLGYVQREMARHVGQLLATQITARQRSSAQLETVRLSQQREELLHLLTGVGEVEDSMLRHPEYLLRTIPADGFAMLSEGGLARVGSTPPDEVLQGLLPELGKRGGTRPFVTRKLVDEVEGAEHFAAAASGAMVSIIRSDPELIVAWFRAEEVETINWAGNPHKPVEEEAGMLTPRKSFDLWRETVRHEARRWSAAETASLDRLRQSLLAAIDQQEVRRLNRHLRRTLSDKEELIAQKDLLMREVHHRVQNSLQLVNSVLHVQERDAGEEVRAQFELARQRLTAVAMVHRRLWRTDKLGDVRLDSFAAELVEGLVGIWGDEWRDSMKIEVAPLTLSTDVAVLVGLVLTELLTNAVKYAYDGKAGPVTIEASEIGHGDIRLAIVDRGVGFDPALRKESFGTRLVGTLVKQLGGRVEVKDNGPGARVELTFPMH